MRRTLLGFAIAAAGCGSSNEKPIPAPTPIVQMVVDADRNGVADPKSMADVAFRDAWDASHGAVMLANVDDDDGDHKVDAEDQVVNGGKDEADLARIVIVASPGTPVTARGAFAIDRYDEIHLFKHGADGGWTLFVLGADTLSGAELQAGVEFGIEAVEFPHGEPAGKGPPAWDGSVEVSFAVTGADGSKIGSDKVKLRAAPLLLQSNIATPDHGYVATMNDPDSPPFVTDVEAGAMAAGIPVTEIDAEDTRYSDPQSGPDQWTQDLFEVGYTSMPGASGPHWMWTVVRTPVPDRIAADYTEDEMLAPDFGWVWPHSNPYKRDGDSASLDSFGNLDAIPPYDNPKGSSHYPLGRVLVGGNQARHMDPVLTAFLDAQAVQGPVFVIDTAWLFVGHVDEVLSFVKANSPRGWKLLMASPARARALLMELVAKDQANANVMLFPGLKSFNDNGNEVAAQITIGKLLADADKMAVQQVVQAKIDAIRAALQKEIGLTDDEIIDMPVLFESIPGSPTTYVAYSPGLVNLLALDGTLLPPKAHGPTVSGMDAFAAEFEAKVSALGDTVRWVEDWNLYHRLDGEVHCGTNVARKLPAKSWWEVTK